MGMPCPARASTMSCACCKMMMPLCESDCHARRAQELLVRISGMLAVQWQAPKRALRASVLFAVDNAYACMVTVVRMAHGEAVSSLNHNVAYAYFVGNLEYAPPTVRTEQGSARKGRTGSNCKCDVRKVKIHAPPRKCTTLCQIRRLPVGCAMCSVGSGVAAGRKEPNLNVKATGASISVDEAHR